MSNLPSEFYWIGEAGFHRTRIATTYIGPETKLLERLAKTVPKAFTNLMPGVIVAISEEVVSIAKFWYRNCSVEVIHAAPMAMTINLFLRFHANIDGSFFGLGWWRWQRS